MSELEIKKSQTCRGFDVLEFEDHYGVVCSLQKSSLASDDAIWLGPNDANPRIMASDARKLGVNTESPNGWVPWAIPDQVLMDTRMHLTREQVGALLPILQRFVETGEVSE